jgi:TolA-binding protein
MRRCRKTKVLMFLSGAVALVVMAGASLGLFKAIDSALNVQSLTSKHGEDIQLLQTNLADATSRIDELESQLGEAISRIDQLNTRLVTTETREILLENSVGKIYRWVVETHSESPYTMEP